MLRNLRPLDLGFLSTLPWAPATLSMRFALLCHVGKPFGKLQVRRQNTCIWLDCHGITNNNMICFLAQPRSSLSHREYQLLVEARKSVPNWNKEHRAGHRLPLANRFLSASDGGARESVSYHDSKNEVEGSYQQFTSALHVSDTYPLTRSLFGATCP